MLDFLKLVKPLDWIIAGLGGIMIWKIDFSAVDYVDIIYLTTIIMWFGMLLVRLSIQYRRSKW